MRQLSHLFGCLRPSWKLWAGLRSQWLLINALPYRQQTKKLGGLQNKGEVMKIWWWVTVFMNHLQLKILKRNGRKWSLHGEEWMARIIVQCMWVMGPCVFEKYLCCRNVNYSMKWKHKSFFWSVCTFKNNFVRIYWTIW